MVILLFCIYLLLLLQLLEQNMRSFFQVGHSLGTPHWTLRSNNPPNIFTATTTILQGLRRGNPTTLEKTQIVFTAVCKTPASKNPP